MAKKKNKDLIEEIGVGYIKVQVIVKKGPITESHTTKFGFAATYTMASLKDAAEKLKEMAVTSFRNNEPAAEKITVNAKIFHTECEYLIPSAKDPVI